MIPVFVFHGLVVLCPGLMIAVYMQASHTGPSSAQQMGLAGGLPIFPMLQMHFPPQCPMQSRQEPGSTRQLLPGQPEVVDGARGVAAFSPICTNTCLILADLELNEREGKQRCNPAVCPFPAMW